MTVLKSWLGRIVTKENTVKSSTVLVSPRQPVENFESMTKNELLDYAKKRNITISVRKRKQEIIEILLRK